MSQLLNISLLISPTHSTRTVRKALPHLLALSPMGQSFSKVPETAVTAPIPAATDSEQPPTSQQPPHPPPINSSYKRMRTSTVLDHLSVGSPSLHDRYILGDKIGEGAFGVVSIVTSRENAATYACKTISKSRFTSTKQFDDVRKEIQILSHLKNNKNIVELIDVLEDQYNVYIVLELCSGGELFEEIVKKKTFSEADAAAITRFMLSVVQQCHSNKVVHRDLKPENFLFLEPASDEIHNSKDRLLKVTDFGLSSFFEHENQLFDEKVGTPFYVAPEVLKGSYTTRADVWSVGTILYILLSGRPPFTGSTDEKILHRILRGTYDLETDPWPQISPSAKDVLRKLLTYDYKQRPSAEDMLNHPWVRENGVASFDPIPMAAKFLSQMKEFYLMNKMKKMALMKMANYVSLKNLKQLENVFDAIDTDHSGFITSDEITAAFERRGIDVPGLNILDLVKAYDADFDGKICYQEFIAALIKRSQLVTRENVIRAFSEADLNSDGRLTKDEVLKLIGSANACISDAEKIITEADKDGDGMISLDEFIDLFTQELESETNIN